MVASAVEVSRFLLLGCFMQDVEPSSESGTAVFVSALFEGGGGQSFNPSGHIPGSSSLFLSVVFSGFLEEGQTLISSLW